jgi:ribA/ribD-fused uncharacterized protein
MYNASVFTDKFVTVNGKFCFFWKGWPSQWYGGHPFKDKAGYTYSHPEQYMMAKKADVFGDRETFKKIMATNSPREQKDLGRQVKGYDDTAWGLVRLRVVFEGSVLKFVQHDSLRKKLLATDDLIMVEASPFDRIWGIGLAADDPRALNQEEWPGQNLLGKALDATRHYLRTGEELIPAIDWSIRH